KRVNNLDQLMAFSRAFNEENMQPPLSDAIAVQKAVSAWQYEQLGLNTIGQRAVIFPERLRDLSANAVFLYMRLQHDHFWRDQFTMTRTYGLSLGMGWRKFSQARDELIAAKAIRLVKLGGKFNGDASMYAWIKKGGWN